MKIFSFNKQIERNKGFTISRRGIDKPVLQFFNTGFTFIELLVVIGIMTVLGVVAFANFKSLQDDQSLTNGVSELIAFLRVAQTNATARVECTIPVTPPATPAPAQGGALWRVEFDNDKKTATLVCQFAWDGPESIPIKQITLKNNVEIQSIRGAEPANTVIVFNPVYGDAVFGSCVATCTQLTDSRITFQIRHTPTNTTKSFTLDKGGSIDIQ